MITHFIKVFVLISLALPVLSQPLEFEFSTTDSPTPGGTMDVSVKVSNFDQLLSAQVGIYWDSTVLEIDTVPFVSTDLPDFNRQSLSLPEDNQTVIKGKVKLSWSSFSLNPQSLPDDTELFTLRFNVIGDACDMTALFLDDPQPPFLQIEVIHNAKDEIGAISNDFAVMIPGTDCGDPPPPPTDCMAGDLVFEVEDISADQGTNVCVPVLVENFVDVATFQGSFVWDPSILEFTEVRNVNLPGAGPGNFNINESAGTAVLVWFDNTGGSNTQTLADGSALFEICFNAIGAAGSKAIVQASDSPTSLSVGDSANTVYENCIIPGCVNVTGMINPTDFTIVTNSVQSCNQSRVCVDVTVDNFTDIISTQFTLHWDNNLLCYSGLENLNQTIGLFESLFFQQDDVLRLTWGDPNGFTLPNGTRLFTVCYDVKNPSSTFNANINVVDDNVPIEIVKIGDEIIDFALNIGQVQNCTTPNGLDISFQSTSPNCNGQSTGSITATVSGGTAPYTCSWGAPINATETTNGTCTQNGLSAGTYTLTVTDASGTSETAQTTISQPNAIAITGSTSPQTLNNNGSISFNISGGTPPYTQSWTGNIDPTNVPAGTYTLLVTDANGCQETEVFTVGSTLDPVVVSVTGIFAAGCTDNGRICIECTGGSGTYMLPQATPPLTFDSNQGCFVNVPPGNYTIRCRDNAGQEGTRDVTVSRSTDPISVTITNIVPAQCEGGGTFDINTTGGCPGYAITLGLDGGAKVPFVPGSAYLAGNYTVCVRDAAGNETTVTFNLPTVNTPAPSIQVENLSGADCNGDGTVRITINDGCNPQCEILENGVVVAGCNNGGITSLPAGSYVVQVTDDQGLTASSSFNIGLDPNIPPLNIALNGVTDAPCGGMDGLVDVNVTGGCGASDCMIQTNGGALVPCEFVGTAIQAAEGNSILTFTDAVTGSTSQISVTVGIAPDALGLNLVSTTASSIDIEPVNGLAPFSYSWTFENVVISNEEDLTGLTMAGTYTVIVTDAEGCTSSLSVTIAAGGGPSITIFDQLIEAASCGGNMDCDGVIVGSVSGGTAPYTLTFTDQFGNTRIVNIDNDGEFTVQNVCGGSYSLVVGDAAGNESVFSTPIIVPSPLELIITEDTINCEDPGENNGSISVFVEGGDGGYVYEWSPSLPNQGPSNENLAAGNYLLRVTDVSGCAAELLLTVPSCTTGADGCGEAISVISPNNDGMNDLFLVNCDDPGAKRLLVFDRWGRSVFESADYNNTWGGLDQDGQELPEGAYYWVYEVNGRIFKGTVTLLRD